MKAFIVTLIADVALLVVVTLTALVTQAGCEYRPSNPADRPNQIGIGRVP